MDEQTIIQQILHGHTEQFALIVSSYSQKLLTFVSRMVPQPLDAEEIAEDAFVKAYQHLRTYSPAKASFFTWLCRIAYNEGINHLHKTKPALVSIEDMPPLTADAASDTASDTTQEDPDTTVTLLELALQKLPEADRLLIEMYYYDDKPIKDIAFITGHSASRIATHLHRLRKHLYKDILTLQKNGKL